MLVCPPNRKVGVSLSNALIFLKRVKRVPYLFGKMRGVLNEKVD